MSEMKNTSKTWMWIQSNGLPFKIISNPKEGTITVYNANGKKNYGT